MRTLKSRIKRRRAAVDILAVDYKEGGEFLVGILCAQRYSFRLRVFVTILLTLSGGELKSGGRFGRRFHKPAPKMVCNQGSHINGLSGTNHATLAVSRGWK